MFPYLIAGAIGFVVAKLLEEDEAPKYADGGLIAPNGKPSNLTPEQYKLVRSQAFKNWFGDWENDPENASKIVDSNGEPLLVYHGTKSNEEFNVFKQSSRFEFIYFAKTKEYAWFHFTKDIIDKPFQLRPFFLNIRNLLNGEEYGFEKVDFSELKSFFYGIHELSKDIQLNPKSQYRFWEVLRFSNDIYDSLKNQDYYDGISFYENFYDNTTWNDTDDYSLSYVVMNPHQIKLADGTNTTFDGNNPDIRFEEGGLIAPNGKPSNLTPEQYKLVRSDAFKNWFGDWENSPENASKVIDENGEPLVVLHGTNSNYNIFKKSKNKSYPNNVFGFFFTTEKWIADSYGKNIGYHFLNLRNPITLNDVDFQIHLNYKTWDDNLETLKEYKKDKIDGIYYKNNIYVAFEPNQIKLADGTNTTFDGKNPDIRYKKGGEVKDLIVLHNINAHQIEEANKIGGLVTPSIAIVKAENSFTDFGSITLIGTKELIDPENRSVKVFAGDVYSPSVPRKLYYVDKRLLEKITNELIKKAYQYDGTISKSDREIYGLVQKYIGDYSDFEKDLNTRNINELNNLHFDKLKLVYIVEKGIKIKVPMKEKKHFLFNNLDFTLTPEQKKRFAPILREYTTESNEKGSSGISKEIKSKVYDLFLEVLNNMKSEIKEKYKNKEQADKIYEIMTDGLDESFEKNIGTRYDWYGHSEYNLSRAVYGEQILDTEKFNQNIKKVFTKQVIEEYKKWLSDFISQFQGSSYFLKGNEKVPYTLDNLVDATSNRVVGQEKNMTFGVNQAKSFGTKRLNSIAQIKKNSNNLISKEEMNLIDKKNSDNFFNLSQSLKYSSSNDWSKLDSLSRAIADYYKGTSIVSALRKNDFSSPSSYQIDLFKYFADELKNSPVDYFEAKYQRAVSLSEFKYAVVPKNTSKEVLQILLDNGIIIKKYESEEQRLQIINTISNKDKSIKFEEGGSINSGAFKKWFGNSKVVDKKGNPLKVYHGSPDLRGLKEKYIFESRFADNQSFFFTDNYSMAKSYADPKNAFDYQNAEEGVIGLYLSLQNPLIVNAFNQIWRKFETTIDGNEIIGTRNLIKFANNKGYDGVIVENVRDYYNGNEQKTKGGNVYVAFKPNQIKLADGTNTTFDSNNPDIRFVGGGILNKLSKENVDININEKKLSGITDINYTLGETKAHIQFFGESMGIEGIPSWAKKEFYIKNIYRDNEKGIKGSGLILLKKIFEHAKRNSVDIITLKRAEYSGEKLRNYYTRIGFVDVGKKEPLGMYLDLRTNEPLKKIDNIIKEQIKLADGTNTTFDGENPDIRFADGGLIAPNGKSSNTNPYIYDNHKLVKMIEDSIEKDGSSFICTYVASAVKMLEGNNVKIYGFSIYNNPDAEYFSDEEDDEGHHFAVLDDRYILDAWIFNNYQDYQAKINFNRSVFDLQNKEDEKIIKFIYGNRNKWVDITKNVENFADLFPRTYKDLIDGYELISESNYVDVSNTTFDGENADIRYAGGGELKYKNEGAYAVVTQTNKNEWYLNMIEAEIEKKGYAQKIMNQIIEDAKNKKVKKITLDTSLMNKDYFEYGYGFEEKYFNDDDDLYRMELNLN